MAVDLDIKKREAETKRRLIDEAKERIRQLINKVPLKHSTWSYQRTVAFKDAVATARSVLSSERTTVERAQSSCSALENFHR